MVAGEHGRRTGTVCCKGEAKRREAQECEEDAEGDGSHSFAPGSQADDNRILEEDRGREGDNAEDRVPCRKDDIPPPGEGCGVRRRTPAIGPEDDGECQGPEAEDREVEEGRILRIAARTGWVSGVAATGSYLRPPPSL